MTDTKERPKRHQRKRVKGFRLPEGVVCVTRPGKWGNPFGSAEEFERVLSAMQSQGLSSFEIDLRDANKYHHMAAISRDIGELEGKELACFCSLNKPCHADVLIEYANQ